MSEALRPARIDFSDARAPRSLDFDDVYHPRAGASAQARHVFLAGNDLPARWSHRARFVILETGFGLGHNFLAAWAAWRDDPQRCEHLWFVSIEKHPPVSADLRRAHADSPLPELAAALIDAWPPLTPDLHALEFEDGRVSLRLALGDIGNWLPELMLSADAFFLDGFAPSKNPAMWSPQVLHRLRHLAAPDATASTWSVARPVRDGLVDAGFAVERHGGFDTKREMLTARFAPRFALRVPPGRQFGRTGVTAVVGAGLAGAAAARALRRHGVQAAVFEQAPSVAASASGNPGGLLHGVVHADDGPYARWHRAAYLHSARLLGPPLADRAVAGALSGLLRLEQSMSFESMCERVERLALPNDYVIAVDAASASERAGIALSRPAWLYPGGGWVDAGAVVRAWLGDLAIETRCGARVERLQATPEGRWQLIDVRGRCLTEADHVVLANAQDAQRLAGVSLGPTRSTRGQITVIPASAAGCPRTALPLAGSGYLLTLPSGDVLCGATSDVDDPDPAVRDSDHRRNLDALGATIGRPLDLVPGQLTGRVAWRLSTSDRLPLVGELPRDDGNPSVRPDQPRFLPRRAGLHLLGALGSRGIAQSALAGEIVASWISASPMPVGRSTLDAVDVARHLARAWRFKSSGA
jgi:tRNA 5-methylaminomethyl-2-thiouridine biosynthesis bifunctional protein